MNSTLQTTYESTSGSPMFVANETATATKPLTFLFTDLTGSTPLWEESPAAMHRALISHNRILNAAIASRRGRAFAFVGDGILACFGSARDALEAAIAIQRALRVRDRKLGAGEIALAPRIRLALHCGEAIEHDGTYLGLDLCLAARLVSSAHGGQILLSEAAGRALGRMLPRDCRLRDMGRYRLRGISPSEQIHIVDVSDLPLIAKRPTARPAFRSFFRLLSWLAQQMTMLMFLTLIFVALPQKALAAPPVGPDDYPRVMLETINAEREGLGLLPLTRDSRLDEAARAHVDWMVSNRRFSHVGAGGSRTWDRAIAAGYDYLRVGEVLARGHSRPEAAVSGYACNRYCSTLCLDGGCDGWKQSDGHWRILTRADYRDIGVAYHPGSGSLSHWWVAVLGQPSELSSSSLPSTSVPSATATRVPATATSEPSATATRVPATATSEPSATATRVPATATSEPSATATRVPATATSEPSATSTQVPATATPEPSATATKVPTEVPALATVLPTLRIQGQVHLGGRAEAGSTYISVDGAMRQVTDAGGRFELSLRPKSATVTVAAYREGWLMAEGSWVVGSGPVLDLGRVELVPGDLTRDGRVDNADYLALAAPFGACRGERRYEPVADLDDDGCVQISDARLVLANFGRRGPTEWRQP